MSVSLTPSIDKAISLINRLHEGQYRKGGDKTPYASHPVAVAWIVNQYTNDPKVIVASLLHDVPEDVKGYTLEDIEREFGPHVAKLVKGVTEDKDPNIKTDKKATWGQRKEKKLASLKNACEEVLLICAADNIHNLRSCVVEFKETGRKPWENFNASVELQVWYRQEVLGIMKERIPTHPIVNELDVALKSFLIASGQANRF